MGVTGVYHHTYLDKVLTECLWTRRLGRWYARARKKPSFCAAWAYEFSPLQMDQMSMLRISGVK